MQQSAAPKVDRLIEETMRTPFTTKITKVCIQNVGKMGLPIFEELKIYFLVVNENLLQCGHQLQLSSYEKHEYSIQMKLIS